MSERVNINGMCGKTQSKHVTLAAGRWVCMLVYFGQDVFGDLQEGVVSARAAPSLCAAALSQEQ